MKKLPFYFYLVIWITSAALANFFLKADLLLLRTLFATIFFLLPTISAFTWLFKNRLKVKNFYKQSRKKFKHIFYTIESLVCLTIIGLIISIITVGGFKNFSERAKFEYVIFNDQYDMCSNSNGWYVGYGEFDKFNWKANTQFIDYFQYKPYKVVKDIVKLKVQSLYKFNHCKAIRYLLRAAHQGHKVSKDILATLPDDWNYKFADEKLFKRYQNSLDEKKLYNPALVFAFANKTDDTNDKDYLLNVEKRRKLYKEAAEEGYLLAMQDYLYTFSNVVSDKSDCPYILKYSNHLIEQNSFMQNASHMFSSIGIISWWEARTIYECSDKKIDFRRGIILMENFNNKTANPKKSSLWLTTYPALIYFNGWGNVEKDQELAIELFSKNNEAKNGSKISKAYLSLNKLNNYQDGLELLNEIIDSEVTTYEALRYIYCDNIKYNFKIITKVYKETKQEKQSRITKYLEPLKSCLNNSSREEGIKSVQSYIKSWIENRFKNPELVKTLNLYG